MIDSQLVANDREVFSQQSVVVERANQIFQNITFLISQVEFAHLLFQLVVERFGFAVHDLLAFLGIRAATLVHRQVFIVATDTAQGLVECTLTFLTLAGSLKILGAIVIATTAKVGLFGSHRIIVVGLFALQSGVIVHFGVDTVNQLRHWQLYQRRL